MNEVVLNGGDVTLQYDGNNFICITSTSTNVSRYSCTDLGCVDSSIRQLAFIALCFDACQDTLQPLLRFYAKELNEFLCECYEDTLRYRVEDLVDLISDVTRLDLGYYRTAYSVNPYLNLFMFDEYNYVVEFYSTSTRKFKLTIPKTANITHYQAQALIHAFLCYLGFGYKYGTFTKFAYLENLLKLNTALPIFNGDEELW